jgi:hypothetical protein
MPRDQPLSPRAYDDGGHRGTRRPTGGTGGYAAHSAGALDGRLDGASSAVGIQLGGHPALPAFVGEPGGDQKVAPILFAEGERAVQPAQVALGDQERGQLDALDRGRVAGLTGKDVAGQLDQRRGDQIGVMREIRLDAPFESCRDPRHPSTFAWRGKG